MSNAIGKVKSLNTEANVEPSLSKLGKGKSDKKKEMMNLNIGSISSSRSGSDGEQSAQSAHSLRSAQSMTTTSTTSVMTPKREKSGWSQIKVCFGFYVFPSSVPFFCSLLRSIPHHSHSGLFCSIRLYFLIHSSLFISRKYAHHSCFCSFLMPYASIYFVICALIRIRLCDCSAIALLFLCDHFALTLRLLWNRFSQSLFNCS
jgi:hypothetical protein